MTNLKTKEEMYREYLEEIRRLENEVTDLTWEIGNKKDEIVHKKYRIKALQETAEIFEPNKNGAFQVINES